MEKFRFHIHIIIINILLFINFRVPVNAVNMRFYDDEQLSSDLITSLCQDQQGYIWIGTEYGLNKFDGVFFKQYYNDDENPLSLSDNIVRQLMTDSDGFVWVVNNRGVQRYNRMTDGFDAVTFGEGQAANVNDILQTPDGKIWVLSAAEGIFEVSTGNLTARPIEAYNRALRQQGECDNMYYDSKGRVWVAYKDRGLVQIDTRTGKSRFFSEASLPEKTIDIQEDSQHRLTIATYASLLQLDERRQAFETVVTFPRCAVYRLYKDSRSRLYIGSSGDGIRRVDLDRRELLPMTEPMYDKIYAFLEDRSGNQWIGSYQRGLLLVRHQPDPFHFLPLERIGNNNGNVLRSVFADSRRHVYICQEKGGITGIDGQGNVQCHWMGDKTVMTMYEDTPYSFWVGTYRHGLFRIDPQTGREEWMPLTGTQRIGSITKDREGNLYTAVFNDGLHSYTSDGKTERILGKGELKLANPYLNTLFTDSDGRIWIGHYYGIDVYDPKTDRLVDVSVPEALRPAIVYTIGQSPKGKDVWVGSNKGLFRYHTQGEQQGQWQRLTTKDGLPNDIICGLVTQSDGSIWVSTFRGLGKIVPGEGITSYYRGNGLEEWSYLRGVHARSAVGEIILGNQNGITYFMPENITNNAFLQGITITSMRLGDIDVNPSTLSNGNRVIATPIDAADDITMSYLDNTFSLRFSPMDFRDAQNVHYEFRFSSGPADQWYKTESGRSEIYFSHLAAGSHHLIVRAYDNGAYSPEKLIVIHITPPWYRSWGAYAFYLMLIGILAFLWWRYYWNKRQAEINEEKIKFFVDISHELRSPLTLIKSPLEKLLKSSQAPSAISALRIIERNTNRLLTLTNQILSIRKIEKGQMTMHFAETPLGEFVNNICHDYDYQVDKRQIRLVFTNEDENMKVWIDRDHFDKVVTNLINNAIKYVADGGEIDVSVRRNIDGQAELVVKDNGTGIDESQLRKIFERFYQVSARPTAGQMSYGIGLNLTQKIVKMHHGTISAHNRTDVEHGSAFVVRLPLGSQHLPQEQLVDNDYYTMPTVGKDAANSNVITDTAKTHRIRKKTTYHIAVVDDDEDIRQFLQTELSDSYHVHTYADGQKALEGISDLVPDLVISDVVMPVMDGFELLKRIKGSTKTSHIPVILLTTRTDHLSRVEGLDQGADAYVDKPFNMEELEARISSLIANRIRVRGKFSGVQEQEDTVRKIELKGNDAALMEKIMKAVNERLDDSDFNVEALADDIGMSRAQLHRRMKDLTGITAGEFIRNLRLQQAAKLLAAGDTSVAQVTYAVGFANPNHFTSAFKKHFGVTPSEYMSKHKQKKFEV